MVADTFSEEYKFLLGTSLKKRWGNHPPAIQKRVKKRKSEKKIPAKKGHPSNN
jgi:hypothetical protein